MSSQRSDSVISFTFGPYSGSVIKNREGLWSYYIDLGEARGFYMVDVMFKTYDGALKAAERYCNHLIYPGRSFTQFED